jgi:hypothetical protein
MYVQIIVPKGYKRTSSKLKYLVQPRLAPASYALDGTATPHITDFLVLASGRRATRRAKTRSRLVQIVEI